MRSMRLTANRMYFGIAALTLPALAGCHDSGSSTGDVIAIIGAVAQAIIDIIRAFD